MGWVAEDFLSSWCIQGVFVISEVCQLALGSAHPHVSIDGRVY